MDELQQIRTLLGQCTAEQRHEIFRLLRQEFRIHPLEDQLNANAEVILEAIHRSSDLTLRGVRGVIAQAAFDINVTAQLTGWQVLHVEGDPPYDSLIRDSAGAVRIQVKMQRLKDHQPMMASEAYRYLPRDKFVVETQRTRGGRDPQTGRSTRPYRFGEFDILAVSLHPSTNDWTRFLYTVERWLISDPNAHDCLLKFQPVPRQPNDEWTDDLLTSIRWLRSDTNKTIR